eukprot:scaffold65457_cov85-Phaeocystis_antarctica.AAC.2
MSGHHPGTNVRMAWRKRRARFEISEALAEQPAVVRTAVELHGCCARVSLAEALLRQHIDGVARASSVSNESGSRARSLVLLTMLAPVSRTARLGDQLGLDDEVNSEIADGYTTGSSARPRVAVGDLSASSGSAPQLGPGSLGRIRGDRPARKDERYAPDGVGDATIEHHVSTRPGPWSTGYYTQITVRVP